MTDLQEAVLYAVNVMHEVNNEINDVASGAAPSTFPSMKELINAGNFIKGHLQRHTTTYRVYQEKPDPFKIMAWMGLYLHQENRTFHLRAVVYSLNHLLEQDSRSLPSSMLDKITLMAMNDGRDDDVAIGKNGLYLIFRSCHKLSIQSNPG